jgi:hypothetical protein
MLSPFQRGAAQHLGQAASAIALPLFFEKNVVHFLIR